MEVYMEGLISLVAITLVIIILCGMTYLFQSFMQMVFKLVEIKRLLDTPSADNDADSQ